LLTSSRERVLARIWRPWVYLPLELYFIHLVLYYFSLLFAPLTSSILLL
jgi:hypothetical protein